MAEIDETITSEAQYYKEWLASPRKYCLGCGSAQSYNQYTFTKECYCGEDFREMSEDVAKSIAEEFMNDHNDSIMKRGRYMEV